VTYLGIVLLVVGIVLWLTITPGLGWVLIVIGLILLVLGLVLGHRGAV